MPPLGDWLVPIYCFCSDPIGNNCTASRVTGHIRHNHTVSLTRLWGEETEERERMERVVEREGERKGEAGGGATITHRVP